MLYCITVGTEGSRETYYVVAENQAVALDWLWMEHKQPKDARQHVNILYMAGQVGRTSGRHMYPNEAPFPRAVFNEDPAQRQALNMIIEEARKMHNGMAIIALAERGLNKGLP